MAIQPNQPQGIGGVLDTAFQLYKASIGQVWPLCLLLVIVGSPPSIYMFTQAGALSATDPLATLTVMQSPTYWLIYLVTITLTLWVIGALYLKQQAIAVDEELGAGAALGASIGRAVVLLLMSLLGILAVMIGSILLLIPGLILMVSFMLAANLVLFEGKGPVASLTGSHKLVWGNWWRTAAILTIGFIIVLVLYFAAAMIIGIVAPLVGMDMEDPMMFGLLSGLIVGVLMNLLVTPFYIALILAIYWDLKLRKEGGDLAARVGALNAA